MNNKKGFTIIELIVVIAIIAILAAIVLLNVTGYIRKGQDASLKESMHTVQTDVISNATTSTGLAFASITPCSGVDAWNDGVLKLQKGTNLAECASNYAASGSANDLFCACVQELSDTTKYVCVDTERLAEKTSSCLVNCSGSGDYMCE